MKKELLQEAFSVERKLPLNFEDIQGSEHFIFPRYQYGQTYVHELRNALVTPYGIVYKKGKVLEDSVYSMFKNNNHYGTLIKKTLLGKIRKVPGLCISANHAYYDNFYHFTIECLMRLYSIRQYIPQAKLLLPEKAPGFIYDYLQLLGVTEIVKVKDDELIKAERLLIPGHQAEGLEQNRALLREMIDYIRTRISPCQQDFQDYKNIYVSRKKAKYRNILNEEEVLALLHEYNFKVVCLEDYSISEKICLMSQVRNMVAVHGSGITNIIFMRDNGLLIDLIHDQHFDKSFYNLAQNFDHDTIFVQGEGDPATPDPTHGNFKIDIPQLRSYLEKYLKA